MAKGSLVKRLSWGNVERWEMTGKVFKEETHHSVWWIGCKFPTLSINYVSGVALGPEDTELNKQMKHTSSRECHCGRGGQMVPKLTNKTG